MDILRYGAGVEVIAPKELRGTVRDAIAAALKKYT
jgi:predicted DNA-binding transcriptional regulator YafY